MSDPETPQKLEPLFNPQDDEWVLMVGRFMLNMGVIEFATKELILKIRQMDLVPIVSDDLSARIAFIRKKYPRGNTARHQWAMNALGASAKLASFRNIIAHSPLMSTGHADGTRRIQGIMNVTPKDKQRVGELISLEELKGRVNESMAAARDLLKMQGGLS